MPTKILTLCLILLFPNYNITDIRVPYKRYDPIVKEIKNIKVTGYYPYTAKSYEKHIEGSKKDKFGNPIKTLQCKHHYVSVAVDKSIIPLKTYFKIKEIPGKLFYACDVGKKIIGHKIDIAVWNKQIAYNLPKKVTIQILK